MSNEQDIHTEFKQAINKLFEGGMTPSEAADLFDCSVPNVKRWASGASKPALFVQKIVLKLIKEKLA